MAVAILRYLDVTIAFRRFPDVAIAKLSFFDVDNAIVRFFEAAIAFSFLTWSLQSFLTLPL